MDEAHLAAVAGTVLDVGAARLEIAVVRDRRDLQPFVTARRPDLDIVSHLRAKAQVAGTQLFNPIGQSKFCAGLLGVGAHLLQHLIRFVWSAEDVHFDLVELVAAFDAAHVAASAHLLTAETGRVSGVVERERRLVQDLIHVQTGERHLGRRHHPQVVLNIVIQVIGELGQLPRAEERGRLDHERRIFFSVALAGVQVKHPGDQGALQARSRAAQHVEARAGDLDAALEVEDAERRSQVPVGFRLEIVFGQLPDRLDDDIFVLILAEGNARVGEVGDGRRHSLQLLFDLTHFLIECRDLIADGAHRLDLDLARRGVLHLPDFLRDGVALGLERLDIGQNGAALFIQFQDGIDGRGIQLAVAQGFADEVWVLADKVDI